MTERNTPAVVVEHITKYYGTKQALTDISFTADRGEVLGLLGPNGAGKTTTMRILTGFMPPTSGSARVAGFDILAQSLAARRCLGYLPENIALYPEMSVTGFLGFIARSRGLDGRRSRSAIDEAIHLARLEEVRGTFLGRLSRGYRQRVGLAQAILHDPPVLILDEPTVGLDPRQIIETREVIRQLGERRCVILSSHILPEVSALCRRIVILHQGRVVAEDTADNLMARLTGGERWAVAVRGPQNEVTAALLTLPFVTGVSPQPTSRPHTVYQVDCRPDGGEDPGEALAALVSTRGWGLHELRPIGMSLEEIFLSLTTEEPEAEDEEADEDQRDT